jgi:hypothetical protein
MLNGPFVVFVNVPEIEEADEPEAIPVIVAEEGADHEYVVPVGTIFPDPFVGDTVN